jgi:hypothetical protein
VQKTSSTPLHTSRNHILFTMKLPLTKSLLYCASLPVS